MIRDFLIGFLVTYWTLFFVYCTAMYFANKKFPAKL